MNILLVGVGGQGIILASDILAQAAVLHGFDTKKSEVHGMSQRGGSVFSHIRYGDNVYSPVIPHGQADILISLEEMETLRWLDYTNPNTLILYSKTRILPANTDSYPEGIEKAITNAFSNIIVLDPKEIQPKITHPKCFNIFLLGLLAHFAKIPVQTFKQAITLGVPKGTLQQNLNAFDMGYSHLQSTIRR
ncbi:indolepyruvate oxidoreductase subunit beta [Thermoproteota archaeon]